MPHFDIGYFNNKTKRKRIGKVRKIKNRFIAWKLDKEYYDGNRINGYGGFVSDRIGGVGDRLKGFPGNFWKKFNNPIIEYKNNSEFINHEKINKTINDIKLYLQSNKNVCCILLEPIQCTSGDQYFHINFFKKIRKICDQYNIPLIFDEIQTGFYATGKTWYYEHLSIQPDILIFGKKTQISGIMTKKRFSSIFNNPIRLEVTWDGDAVDMVRCKYIIKAYEKYSVKKNVKTMSKILYNEFKIFINVFLYCLYLIGLSFLLLYTFCNFSCKLCNSLFFILVVYISLFIFLINVLISSSLFL